MSNTADQEPEAWLAHEPRVYLMYTARARQLQSETMARAVEFAAGRAVLEASGGVGLDTARKVAETGVHLVSVGALTHSAPALDMSLRVL